MRVPYLRYIEFLITRHIKLSTVTNILKRDSFYIPDLESIKTNLLRRASKEIKAYFKTQKKSPTKQKWQLFIKQVGLEELWYAEPELFSESNLKKLKVSSACIKRLNKICERRDLRLAISCLLLKDVVPEEIIRDINNKFECRLTLQLTNLFKKYFFDVVQFTKDDWINYLRATTTKKERKLILMVMNDGIDRLKYELGLAVKMDYGRLLNDVMITCYFKFKNTIDSSSGDINNEKNARDWGKMMFEAGDRKEKYSKGDMEDFADKIQMEFTFEHESFPTYDEVLNEETSSGTGKK